MNIKTGMTVGLLSLAAAAMGGTYYVNPSTDPITGGNDAWDGTAEVWEGGSSLRGPKRTLVGVTEVATNPNDVIIALPGVYDDRLAETSVEDQYVRVIVPDYVTLKSRDGAARTIIMGKAADTPAANCYGCGSGSPARCVQLGANARLEGFTLTGGRTKCESTTSGENGGAISAASTAGIAYCIISNNVARRSGATNAGRFFGCTFLYNRSLDGNGNVSYGAPSLCNCYVDCGPEKDSQSGAEFYNSSRLTVVNCTFGPHLGSLFTGNGGIDFFNCIDLSSSGCKNGVYTYSAYAKKHSSATVGEGSFLTTADKMALYEDGSLKSSSKAIDVGDVSLYTSKVDSRFADSKDCDRFGNVRVVGGKIDLGCNEQQPQDWYVDVATGDDANGGRSADKAFRTLSAACRAEHLHDGDVIHVARGTYEDGVDDASAATRCRVHVPAGVTLLATEGPEVTTIRGAASTSGDKTEFGNGTGAVRCVCMDEGAKVVGFTLKDGRTAAGERGGGASAGKTAYLVDCIVSDNSAAGRGGAINTSVTSVRCRYLRNFAEDLAMVVYGGATFFDCYFADNTKGNDSDYAVYAVSSTGKASLYNCTFAPGDAISVRGLVDCYNCLFRCPITGSSADTALSSFYSCAMVTRPTSSKPSYLDSDCLVKTAAELAIDSLGRPAKSNLGVDKGSNLCHVATFPFADEKQVDLCGSNRIYNGRIDIGCCEYDWCGDFAKDLARKDVSVVSASAGVTETSAKRVALADGDSLTAEFSTQMKGSQPYSLKAVVFGSGTLTVTLPDETQVAVTSADGERTISFSSAKAANEVSLAFVGDGHAETFDFRPPRNGLVLIFR